MGLRGVNSKSKPKREKARRKPMRGLPPVPLPRVEAVIRFLESLPITKGKLAGEKMQLLAEQRRFVEDIYGRERVRIGVLSMPRGNGKTGLIAGLELCHLIGPEAEMRGECYSAAIDRDQAALIFHEMVAIIEAVPELDARINIIRTKKMLEVISEGPGVGSVYYALSADARRAHGLAPSFWCYDELAQAPNRVLLDNLQTAMGKRKRSTGIIISTQADTDEHPLSQIIDDGLTGIDSSIVVHLLSAPKDANPFDEKVIASVNPAFDRFLDRADVMAEARRAFRQPAFESAFRRLRLNQRVSLTNSDQLIPLERWAACDKPVDPALFYDGRPVYGGLDLSSQIDLTALVFACADDDGDVHLLAYAWTPQGTIDERTLRDRVPYDSWVRAGLIKAVPGNSVDYDYVAADMLRLSEGMNLSQVAFDPWRINELKLAFGRIGAVFPLVVFKQNYENFGPAIDVFERLAMDRRIRHGGHAVLRWCVANTVTVMDPNQNRKADKSRAAGRIDLMVAAIMAVSRVDRSPPVPFDVRALIA